MLYFILKNVFNSLVKLMDFFCVFSLKNLRISVMLFLIASRRDVLSLRVNLRPAKESLEAT